MISDDFDSTSNAVAWIPPFRDTTTGAPISGDTVTLKIKSPNGTLYTQASGGVTLGAQDPDTLWRKVTFSNGTLYVAGGGAGDWTILAHSDNVNAVDMPGAFSWGNRLAEQLRLIKTKTNGLPASPATEATAASAAADALLVRRLMKNRWKFDEGTAQLTIYADDGVTPLQVFNNFDSGGLPTTTAVRERVPI